MTDHETFMRMAIELAEANVNTNSGGPFGAVVVKDGRLIAKSANKVIPDKDPTSHAEIAAIRTACQELNTHDLSGCIIYASCEPCPMCLGAIYWARIDHVYYGCTKEDAAEIGFDDKFIYQEIDLKPEERKLSAKSLLREEAIKAFVMWDLNQQKIKY